jgi:transglutaminase-like putative cysteine protease
MTKYDQDPEAKAAILYDSKNIQFIYNNDKGFQFEQKRYIRIKVFKKSGFDYVNFPISLFHSKNNYEKLTAFKAQTYNLVNGKIEKTKLEAKDTFEEKKDKNTTTIKYAMPNLQEGSVVDISYTILSDFLYNLTDWQYQFEIPVEKSDFFAEIPEYFIYKTAFQGYEKNAITKNKITYGRQSFHYRTNNVPSQLQGGDLTTSGTQEVKTKIYNMVAENVPALNSEPFMAATSNYISKVNFELSGTDSPSSEQKYFNRTWEDVRHTLMTDSDFGGRLNRKRPVMKIVEEVTIGLASPQEKTEALYYYVQEQFSWNGRFSHYPRSTTNEILELRTGFSSDLNFLLIQMLRAAEIESFPVSISTRSNGFINPASPQITQFNHVITAVTSGENFILMDPTGTFNPIGLLPRYDLNNRGRLFTEKYSNWINLSPEKSYKTTTQAKLALDEAGVLKGTINMLMSGYAALDFRNRIKEGKEEVAFLDSEEQGKTGGLEIISVSFKNLKDKNEKIVASYEVSISDQVVKTKNLIYLDPLLFFGIEKNPFTSESRKFPVDLSTSMNDMYILQLTLPDGYVIDELPENISFSLPEQAGKFVYEFRKVNDHMLQLTNKVIIKKTFFMPEEYLPLREYFNLVIEKQGAQIVLRKAK